MGLKEYGGKRDFTRTPEPAPESTSRADQRVFVVHKHAARNSHYDLRLRVGDVLKSWAVPRGPSFDPNEKRLAVEVEDHPLKYADFEEVIPEGQYGAGAMMIWDRGTWEPEGNLAESLKDGDLKFRLEGQRLKGRWALVRIKPKPNEKPAQPNWLLIKERDAEAAVGVNAETYATSAATGRTMEEIEQGAPARQSLPVAPSRTDPRTLPGARALPMPARLGPQLAQPAERVPEGADWLHEVKFDGYRLLIFRKGDDVRIRSRSGLDWTAKLTDLANTIRDRLAVDAILDGEAVILDTRGVSDFQALQNAIHNRRAKSVVYFAFDLPWCDGADLTRTPLVDRRRVLAEIVGRRQDGRLRLSEHIQGNGALALQRVSDFGLEGIVSKHAKSSYAQARTADWVKVKCFNQQEFVIGGYTEPEGTREHFGALLLGVYSEKGRLRFAGKVGTGFSAETLRSLFAVVRERIQATPPFENPPTGADARGVTWIKPELVAQIQFRDWSADGVIRHTSFRGLRDDRDPKSVMREAPSVGLPIEDDAPKPKAAPKKKAAAPPPEAPSASRIRLTHPERVVYPDRGAGYTLTKQQVAQYYEIVAPRILPHLAGRPIAIVRCPDGEGTKPFFQKHPAKGMPAAVRGIDVTEDDGTLDRHLMIEDLDGLLGLVQMNALEFHPWGCHPNIPDEPDRIIFDLDPGPQVSWRQVVEGAVLVRDSLQQIGLKSFARTSGGKGIHVVVPVQRGATWDQAARFAKAVADTLARMAPKRFVATHIIELRTARIYVDHLRNARGSTAIAPYSTRNRPAGPIALPIGWDELPGLESASSFNPQSVIRRLAARGPDPWENFEASAVQLPSLG